HEYAWHGYVHHEYERADADAGHADAEANGGPWKSEGRGVRPAVFDGDDSAPQRRLDHGERFVRHCGRGAGRCAVQLHDRYRQRPTRRDSDYAEHVERKTFGGETMNRVRIATFQLLVVLVVWCSCFAAKTVAQTSSPSPAPSATPAAPANPFAPQPAPPLPAGMTGSDVNDPRAKLSPGMYDAGEAAMGIKHL